MNNILEEKVSIIIPAYNAEKSIEKCINSIRRQTYFNIEIIIVNDGSSDNTKKCIEQIALQDERITIINQENQGVCNARNKGICIAKGEYIIFVDADDYVERDMVEILVNDIKQKKTNIVRCNYDYITEKGMKYSNKETIITDEYGYIKENR